MKYDASVILLHYNQSSNMLKSLQRLAKQNTSYSFEVIIADDGSNAQNIRQIEENINTFPIPISIVWQRDKGFTAAKARNNGIKLSSSELIILVDGDNIPTIDFVEQHINVHKDKENILCSGSRIWKSEVELDGNHPSSEVVEKNRFLQKQENIQRYKSYNMNPWQAMYSFNLSFKKQQKTLFDENFIGFGLEDWEFSYRLVKKMGYIPKLKPSIKTIQYDDFHNTRNPFKNINQQDIKCYIKNALYFIEKYPEDKNLHKEIVKFLKKFEYCPKTHKFKRLFVDFQKLDEENIHDTINKYRLITAYKSRL